MQKEIERQAGSGSRMLRASHINLGSLIIEHLLCA